MKSIIKVLTILFSFATLADIGHQIEMPKMNAFQKLDIINFSKALFERAYVNFKHKKEIYKIDPVARLDRLAANIDSYSDLQFHEEVLKIYNSLRDPHTNYALPAPYACYGARLPLTLKKYREKKIIVSELGKGPYGAIHLGDELVAYNGVRIDEFLNSRSEYIAGATVDSQFREGVLDLYFRPLKYSILPTEDEAILTFKNITGKEYTIKMPWSLDGDQSCLKNEAEIEPKKTESISYKILEENNKKIAYLKISDFQVDEEDNVSLLSEILEKKLNSTAAMIIDLRDNGGGDIPVAEQMAALFGQPEKKTLPFYIRSDIAVYRLIKDLSDLNAEDADRDEWWPYMQEHVNDGPIIGPVAMSNVTRITPKYFNKVVILTNAECMSSCEIFVAAMKDNGHVKVYGTDRSTFGAGANVFENANVMSAYLNVPEPVQIQTRFTLRNARRLSDNSLIDDVGILSDEIIFETKDELIHPEKLHIIKKIMRSL